MTSLPYPLTKSNYRLFIADANNQIVINVKNYLTTLDTYTNLFINEQSDTSKLSSYIQSMEESSNLILLTLKDCASSVDSKKCKLPICKYNNEIQDIIVDLLTKFSSITIEKNKEKYNFLPLILTNSFAKLITSNDTNKYADGTYHLCGGTSIKPFDPNSPTFSNFQALSENAKILQENNNQQVFINNIITALEYLAVAIVVITIALIIYNKFFMKKTEVILNKIGGYLFKLLK
jgi:hypothetical protein